MASDPLAEARRYLLLGEPQKARLVLELVLSEHPDHGPSLLLMAITRTEIGDAEGAERDARLAFAHAELRADAAALLARITMARDSTEALGWASEAVRLEPGRSGFRLNLARILRGRRQFEAARREAEAGLMTAVDDGERVDALVTASSIAMQLAPRREEAYRLAEEAARIDPTNPSVGQMLAAAQMASGRRTQAIVTARRILGENPVARVPPYIAQVATVLLVRRLIGLVTLVTLVTPFLTFVFFAQAFEMPIASRAGASLGLLAVIAIGLVVLSPLRDRTTARAVKLFLRQRPVEVVTVIAVVLIALGYLAVVVTGFFPLIALLPFVALTVWTVHEVKLTGLRPPEH
jgi:tetratricopeptide (TPR) repeat protein